jgi:nicotinamide phosphoribosyltransferase
VQALQAAEQVFGCTVNSKGYKVITGCGVIQGDGINIQTLQAISDAALAAGYSAENTAFGMGGALLQRIHRDTMGFATKLCHIRYADGHARDVMKFPKTDASKISLPGVLGVKRVGGVPVVYPKECVEDEDDMLEVIYDCGPVDVAWETFDEMRQRVAREWRALPKQSDPFSPELQAKIERVSAEMRSKIARNDTAENAVA